MAGAQAIIDRFLQLIDSPSSYSGEGGKAILVKGAEDGLEFGAAVGGVSAGEHVIQSGELTTSATYQVVPGLTKTFTPSSACRALIMGHCTVGPGSVGNNRSAFIDLFIDGVAKTIVDYSKTKADYGFHYHDMSILAFFPLTAAPHTIDIRGKHDNETGTSPILRAYGQLAILLLDDNNL